MSFVVAACLLKECLENWVCEGQVFLMPTGLSAVGMLLDLPDSLDVADRVQETARVVILEEREREQVVGVLMASIRDVTAACYKSDGGI